MRVQRKGHPGRKRLHLLAKPTGFVSGMAMDNPGFQMRYRVKLLSRELAEVGTPYVLQLAPIGEDEKRARLLAISCSQ